jgi:hypothetical protein
MRCNKTWQRGPRRGRDRRRDRRLGAAGRAVVLEVPAAFGAGTTSGVISRQDKRRNTLPELLSTFDRA